MVISAGAHAAGTGRLLQQHGTPQEARITRPAAPSPQTSALAPAPGAQSAQADLLFVQQAARAELAFDSDSPTTTAVLTLSNVSPFTTWCAACVLITLPKALLRLCDVAALVIWRAVCALMKEPCCAAHAVRRCPVLPCGERPACQTSFVAHAFDVLNHLPMCGLPP